MTQNAHHIARTVHWLGWHGGSPSTAVVFADDAVWMLALRDRPLRVTACGAVPLSVGTVRNGEIRLVGLAADALRTLHEFLRLPVGSPLTLVVEPLDASVEPDDDRIVALVDQRQIEALAACAEEVESSAVRFDAVPAAIARLARRLRTTPDDTVAVSGAGWTAVTSRSISEVTRHGTRTEAVAVGTGPASLIPISNPEPVRVASGVDLTGPWQLLLGAALAHFDTGPTTLVERREQPSAHGWAAERIAGMAR